MAAAAAAVAHVTMFVKEKGGRVHIFKDARGSAYRRVQLVELQVHRHGALAPAGRHFSSCSALQACAAAGARHIGSQTPLAARFALGNGLVVRRRRTHRDDAAGVGPSLRAAGSSTLRLRLLPALARFSPLACRPPSTLRRPSRALLITCAPARPPLPTSAVSVARRHPPHASHAAPRTRRRCVVPAALSDSP